MPFHDRRQRQQGAPYPAPQQPPPHRRERLIEDIQQSLAAVVGIRRAEEFQAALHHRPQEHRRAGLLPSGKGDVRQSRLQMTLQEPQHQGNRTGRRRIQFQGAQRVEAEERFDVGHTVIVYGLPVVEAREHRG